MDQTRLRLPPLRKRFEPSRPSSPLVLVLIIAAAIALFIGYTQDAVIIWVTVFFTCILSYIQEYRASAAMERLKRTVARTAIVVRGLGGRHSR